ncbi:MAG: Zn finger-containing GTPase- Activating Protein for ARF [Chrysothrix sp. TS-e1954]|nr:MAG: Zn finger-containing GTPase- Activating Protein for ARF [Chrysothrix sp. TS-e1954]
MSKLWEVDPETKAKLLDVQRTNGNNSCVDCDAPSPQWASPKFGIFMCLNCSGIHRGLGVHISFIRSVTMDGFKVAEVKRMQLGGNKPWRTFFDAHKDNKLEGRTFESSTVKERYDSDIGEEWKERLTAKVEGRDYVPVPKAARSKEAPSNGSAPGSAAGSRSQTPLGRARNATTGTSAAGVRTQSPMASGTSQKAQNEAYFAKMGEANASRPDGLAPNQGGKFGGFGSEPAPAAGSGNDDWLNTFQKDPMAGLTKGFGWLGKNAMTGYDGWVKPNVQKLAESDLAAQARLNAANLGQSLQKSSKSAADSFSHFVEGTEEQRPRTLSSSAGPGPDEDKKDFWDSFGAQPEGPPREKEDFWESFGEAPKGPPKEKQDFWESFGEAPKGPPKEKQDFWDSFSANAEARRSSVSQGSGSKSSIGTSAMRKGNDAGGPKGGDDWGQW